MCTIAGTGARGSKGDDLSPLETWLFLPSALALDPEGRLVLVDFNNQKLRRFEGDVLRTIAGSGFHAYASDGINALETSLENPADLTIAPDGTIYFSELHGARILKVDPSGWLTTFAGSPDSPGYECYDGDGGPARGACMSQQTGVLYGDDGSLYIADTRNHVIRRVTPDGIIDTLAGSGEAGFADGLGREALFNQPYGLAWMDGALIVADRYNHRIRRIDPETGSVSTLAGTGSPGFSGDGGPALEAQLMGPLAAGPGPDRALYVTDSDNHVVRRIAEDGTIDTVIGIPGESGFDVDGAPPNETLLKWPNDVLVSEDGDVYIVDTMNDRVRVVRGLATP